MSKYILLVAILAMACTKGISQITTTDFSENPLIANTSFARFDRSENGYDYYWLKLNMFQSEFARTYFYTISAENNLFIYDKNDFASDSALFFIESGNSQNNKSDFYHLYKSSLKADASTSEISKLEFLNNSEINKNLNYKSYGSKGTSASIEIPCSTAEVSCSGNTYTFPSGTAGTIAPTSTGGYPAYGCLSTQPCPAWYYMQVGTPGDINIHISQTSLGDPPVGLDVDFICWGPFNSFNDGCSVGLTGGNIVDCSYSGAAQEDCYIPNAQVGQIYILMMTNFSQAAAEITFAQTGGTGVTNCDIVYNCGIIAVTANPTACSPATNTYNLSGLIEFTNPPANGTLTVTDVTAVPNVSQVFTVTPTFSSPQAYNLNNITCNGTVHTITASFSADATCNLTDTYNAPTSICPIASISGGGAICDNGASTASVLIDLVGVGPFDFVYSFNTVPQPPVTGYNGPFPYVITTAVPGTYGLVSVSNAACPGTVSGTATITMNPLPVPTITGINDVCAGTTGSSYSTEAGKQNYVWNVPTGGTIASGQGTNTINVTWTTAGAHTVTVSYLGPAPSNCAPATPTVYNVNVAPVPTAFAGNDVTVCQGQPYTITDASKANDASFSWQVITGLGTLSNAGTLTPTYTPTAGETGDVVLSLNVSGLSTCSPVADQVTIHILPMATATAGADHSLCQNSTYKIMDAVADHYSSLLWTSNGTGTLTGETTLTPTYQPGAGETGAVTVTLTAYGNLPCGNAVSQLTLTVNPAAVANAGPPAVICEGSNFILSGATAANESSLLWTRSGTGNFDNTTILNPTYIPSAADIAAGSVTLTLTANGLSGCSAVQGSVVLGISRQVIINAGSDAIVCRNNPFTVPDATEQFSTGLLWSHNGTGTLTGETTTTPTYTPGPGDNGIVTLTLTGYANAPCGTVTDALALTVNLPATADAGPTATICEGSTFSLSGSSATNMVSLLWSTSGSGSFDNTSILHPIYTPTAADIAAGSVILTLTATGFASCSAVSSQATLNISRQVVVNAGPDNAICQNTTFTVTGATAQHSPSLLWSHNGGGILSDAGTLSPTYIPAAGESGIVTLTLTGDPISPCGNDIDQMQVTIHPLPVANAGLSGTSCQGSNYTINDATAQFHSSVFWTEDGPGNLVNANTLSPTYIPLPGETGTVTLTLTAQGTASCSAETAQSTRTLTINPLPDVNAGADATICAATTLPVLGIQQFTSVVQWTTSGDGVFTNPGQLATIYTPGANDILSGTVLLTLTGNGSGACSAVNDADQLSLIIDPMPAINAGPDAAFCVTTPVAISGTSAVHYSSLQWITSGDGTISNSAILSPTYAPGNVDFNNGTVTLTLRAFGQLSCAAESVIDSRVLSVSAYPVINAGPDDYICSNVTQFQLNGIGNNYNLGNIQWTFTGGDGTLSNPNVINPVYNAGPIDLSTVNRLITFTLTVQGTGNCNSVFINDQVELRIDPTPISNAGPDDETCGRNPYQLTATGQFQSLINWITSGDGTFSNPGILNPTYTPGPGDVGNTVVLTLDLSGCKSITGGDFLWLTVHPDPGATIAGTTAICEGSTTDIQINLTGTPPWNITYTNGTSPVTVSNILTSPYTFSVTPAITTNWWVTAASDAYCTAPVDSLKGLVTVTVFPLPDKYTATVSNNGVFCEGTAGVSIGLNNSQAGMNYELWQNGLNTGNKQPGTGNALSFGIINIPGQYYVRAINPAGNCIAMMNDTLNVIMNPIPVTDFVASTPCLGDTTVFTVSGQYINSTSFWHWTFGDGTFATYNAPSSPKHLYPAAGIYNVILSVGDTNNCLYTVTHPVEVRPHPTAFFSYNTPNCIGSPAVFTDLSTTPDAQGYINQWIWNFGDGTPSVTIDFPASPNVIHDYLHEGTYEVTLTIMNSRNCGDTYSATIAVTKRPIADFMVTTGCEDEIAVFTDNSDVNGGGQIAAWSWNFGDPGSGVNNFSALQNPVHDYAASGNYVISLIITNLNGCSDTLQKTIYVKSRPLSHFFSSPGCVNSATQFLADSTVINVGATAIYQWNFGDGATSFSRYASHAYVAPGTYNVTLTLTDTAGCVGDTVLPVTVNPPPTALFSANTDNCQGQAVAFANQSVSTSGFITTWEWDFGDGNTQTVTFPNTPNVSHTYAGTGTFAVTLTVTNNEGCQHSETRTVNSLGAPSADFTSSGQCAGTAVTFTDLTSVSGNQTLDRWNWNFGDPASGVSNTSILQQPTHVFATAGTYTVKLITFTGNNCSDTTTKTVTVKPIPAVDFTTQSACAGNPALFAPAGVAVTTISGWYWTFGDGGSSNLQAPTHSYTSPGTFTVTLTITDTAGCSNTISKPIIIAPLPNANFGFSTPTCKGDAVSFSDFSSAASGYVARWTWDFGDGTVQNILFPANPSVTHTYANAGTFNVTLTVKTNDSCTNQLTRVVTILPKPTAAFAHGAACQGNAVMFNDQSISNTTGTINGWNWNFGDPTSGTANNSTLQHPTHSYSTAGTYTAQLIVSIPGGCSDTVTHQVTVSPPPAVDFTPVAGCNGDTTQFTATVNAATTQGYYWQFGDGGTSFIANPVHIYATAGTFTVTLTITDTAGCTNVKVKPVTVIPGPVAAFSSSSPGCSGLPITFTDLSNANGGTITSWYWDFGDGTDTTFTSATSSFAHTYAQPGTFAVKLTVFSAAGCESLKQQTVTITPSPLAAFEYQNTCQGQSTQFTDLTSLNGGSSLTQRAWNFGDPNSGILNTSTQANPTHTYSLPGTYTVTLVTLNGGGCVDTVQQNVSITPKPGVDFYNNSLVCFGNTITLFTDTTVANIAALDYFEWDFGDGSPHAFTQNAQHQYQAAGTYTVTLTVQDTAGCENYKTRPVTIHAKPTPQFTYLGSCENAATQFTDQSLAPQGDTITGWLWEFMQGATILGTDTVQNPTFTFNQPGTFGVKLTTFTEHGCNDTKILPVQIWNNPTAYFKYTASPCANGLVTFQDSSWSYQGLVNSWQWEFEPYQYGSGTHPSHQYYAVDSCYAVTLMIEDLRGCMDTVVQQICVPPALSVDFNTELTCFGSPVTFTPELITPAAPADSLITFSWNFGDPSTGSNNVSAQKTPAHNFSSTGFYTVSFSTTDKFGCIAEKYKTVKVNALPIANFTYTTGQCDSTLVFSSTSIDTSSTINTYIWQYGDGSSDTLTTSTATHKYAAPGEYTATLTVINGNGCTAATTQTVTRSACLVAAAMSTQNLLCQNQTVSFADISTCDGIISQWDWNFGDGTPSESYTIFKPAVTHTYTNPGPYTIRLKVSTLVGTSTISDSTSMDIVVKPTPVAGFTTEAVCLGTKTEFMDTTQSNGAAMLYYRWEFGDEGFADTSNLKNPEYLYAAAGIYTPELIVKNEFGCADTVTSNLTVNGLPEAGYANSLACAGQKTYFFDGSQPYVAELSEWGWRVSDGISYLGGMDGESPAFVFDSAGMYNVLLTVKDANGCIDTLVQQVTVNPAPVSAFSYTENVENIQGQVQFTNGTLGASEYFWDFGNGAVSYAESPLITYADDGIYNVMLVSVSDQGCHDTTMITYEMMFKGLYVPNAMAPGGTIQATRVWKPVGVNLATYTAEIYNSHGMLLWKSSLLDEHGAPAESWDGTYNDKPCQQDVYVWKITAIYRDGSIWYNTDVGEHKGLSEPKWGTVTLVR